ncbi:MAG: 3-oxoacyl-ACP synthase [Candidatus Cryptobacteroides sp.]
MKGMCSIPVFIPERSVYIASHSCICPPADHPGISDDSPRLAELPDFKQVITNANLRRRMGRLLRIAVGCGLTAIENVDSADVAGIVTATGLGFMRDTVDFANILLDRNEELLNPAPFMQSTFNTASGYIAQIRSIHSYNTTYVHRSGGFGAALLDSLMLCLSNPGKGVLAGAFDEVTPEVDLLRRRLGVWRNGADGFLPAGEGTGFIYLTDSECSVRLVGLYPASMEVDCDNVVECSGYVARTGVSHSLLAVVLALVLSEYHCGRVFVRDDVNEGGAAVLLDFN